MVTLTKFFHLGLAISVLSAHQKLCSPGFPLCVLAFTFQVGHFVLEYVILNIFYKFFGNILISPWTCKQPSKDTRTWADNEAKRYVTLLCWPVARCSFPHLCLPSAGVVLSALLFLLLAVRFMSPCASQSLRLGGCFRNKSFCHPIAVAFNYPPLDGDVWKHKHKGFQQFSQCLNHVVCFVLRPLPPFQHVCLLFPAQFCTLNARFWWCMGLLSTSNQERWLQSRRDLCVLAERCTSEGKWNYWAWCSPKV